MAGRIRGCEGTLYLEDGGATEQLIGDMTSFTLSQSSEVSEFAVMGDCNNQSAAASSSYTVSAEGLFDTDDVGQVLILNGATVPYHFYPRGNANAEKVSGSITINQIDHVAAAGTDLQSFTFSGTGNGAIVRASTWF